MPRYGLSFAHGLTHLNCCMKGGLLVPPFSFSFSARDQAMGSHRPDKHLIPNCIPGSQHPRIKEKWLRRSNNLLATEWKCARKLNPVWPTPHILGHWEVVYLPPSQVYTQVWNFKWWDSTCFKKNFSPPCQCIPIYVPMTCTIFFLNVLSLIIIILVCFQSGK